MEWATSLSVTFVSSFSPSFPWHPAKSREMPSTAAARAYAHLFFLFFIEYCCSFLRKQSGPREICRPRERGRIRIKWEWISTS